MLRIRLGWFHAHLCSGPTGMLVLWVYALSAAALLVSVWCRNTQSAILGLYTVVVLVAVGLLYLQMGLGNLLKSARLPKWRQWRNGC